MVSWVAPAWPWVTGIAAALAGAVGLYTTVRADRPATREEARAVRVEERANREEAAHGTAHFPVDLPRDLEVASAAHRLGLINLNELQAGGPVEDAAACILV